MRKCSVIPYEGNESYIFISYSHRDTEQVFPIVEKLAEHGCRIWYDDGIEGGTEWPEVVATHLKECGLCLAFISSNSLSSHNCRREINYSIQRKIPFISVFIEDVELSPGMEMQLSTVQALLKHRMTNEDFYRKLLNTQYVKNTVRAPEPVNPPVSMPQAVPAAPVAPAKPAAPEPVKNDSVRTPAPAKPRKKKGKALKIALIASAACVVLAVGGIVTANVIRENSKVSIGTSENSTDVEKKYDTTSTSITIADKTISSSDISTLGVMTKLETVTFKNCTFEGNAIEGLPNYVPLLKSLSLDTCPSVTDFSFLSSCPNLKYLTLSSCATSNEEFATIDFSKLTALKTLEVKGSESFTDLSPLKNAAQLIELNLSDNAIEDLSALRGQNSLQKVYLNNNALTDIDPLAGCTGLTHLELSGNKISDISPLSSCAKITNLALSGCKLTDISPIGKMENLSTLDLTDNSPESIDVLEKNFRLKVISLESCGISSIDSLKNCSQLYKVNIRKNSINDISVLSKSQKALKNVYLDNNEIEDLTPLKGASDLEILSFDNNLVTSLEPLSQSPKLIRLSAAGNKITSLEGLKSCSKISVLYLPDNQIEDIKAMETIGYSKGSMSVDLSNNKIKEIHSAGAVKYTYFYLHGNPLTSLSSIPKSGNSITLDYNSDFDFESVAGSGFFYITVFDCPTDQIINLEDTLSLKSVKFVSTEEADDAVNDFRDNGFKWQ